MRRGTFILFLSLLFHVVLGQNEINSLNGQWKFKNEKDNSWKNATVPGNIHTDLFNERLIVNPFEGDNEKKLQWIDTCNWSYQTEFEINSVQMLFGNAELVFEGLDTYANVFLNDSLIISTDNMFRTFEVEVKKFIRPGKNNLMVKFISAVNAGKRKEKQVAYTFPGEEKVFTRKAQFQYGWDWAPRFVTCGIWRPVHLYMYNEVKINNVFVNPELKSDSLAIIHYEVNVECKKAGDYLLVYNRGEEERKNKSTLKLGKNRISGADTIRNPRLWWSNGLGKPELYQARFMISHSDKQADTKKVCFGIRKVELIQSPDSAGTAFFFKLNGRPVFMKGANFVPMNSFLPSVSKSQYKNLVRDAREANMNMLRVWGGGTYADEEFYAQCDSNGILVWQDFMFACSMYPGDDLFMTSVEQEAIDNVIRLRNHPCIALWCGNNEISEGWNNWGWQKQFNYTRMISFQMENDYDELFENLLPRVVNQFHPNVNYWPSSPFIGWGRPESLRSGDIHYWGVWWGHEPFEMYSQKIGRFVSEYGFQSFPGYDVVKKYFLKTESDTASAYFKNHQKHPTGFETINEYLLRDYRRPEGIENYVYVSQLLQAEGMKEAVEAHRRAMPYCMGSLYWQLNDCWPSISWSSLDFSGGWKASHYAIRKSFESIKISVVEESEEIKLYAISDSMVDFNATLIVRLKDFKGQVIAEYHPAVKVVANSSIICHVILKNGIADFEKSKDKWFMETTLIAGAKTWTDKYFFVKSRELKLTNPTIQIHKLSANAYEITSDVLAKDVFIQSNIEEDRFSDNYFDLATGEKKIIYLKNAGALPANTTRNLITKSLIDTYQP